MVGLFVNLEYFTPAVGGWLHNFWGQMILLFHSAFAALPGSFLPNTAVVFPQREVEFSSLYGQPVNAFGAYLPSGGSLAFHDNQSLPSYINITIPKTCKQLVVSTRANEHLKLGGFDVCFWYISKPANINLHVPADNTFEVYVESIDGEANGTLIAETLEMLPIKQHILIRLSTVPNSNRASVVEFESISRDNSIPYPKFFTNVTLSKSVQYFVNGSLSTTPIRTPSRSRSLKPVTPSRSQSQKVVPSSLPSDSPQDIWESSFEVDFGGIAVAIVLFVIVVLCGLGCFGVYLCCRSSRMRRQTTRPLEDTEDDAIPPVVLTSQPYPAQCGVQYQPHQVGPTGYFPYPNP
jgi:hypothetical protein